MRYSDAMLDEYTYEQEDTVVERLMDEAGVYGLMDEDCPEVETEGLLVAYLISQFRAIGMEDVADYWTGNMIIHGYLL